MTGVLCIVNHMVLGDNTLETSRWKLPLRENPPGEITPAVCSNLVKRKFENWHSPVVLTLQLTRRGPGPNRPTGVSGGDFL